MTWSDRRLATAGRFAVAGGLASLLNWLVRFPLSALMPFNLAVAVAYGIGMAMGFALYRSWVFPGSKLPVTWQMARFVGVNGLGFVTVVLTASFALAPIARLGLTSLPQSEAVAHGIAILVGAVVNFVGHKVLTFPRRPA